MFDDVETTVTVVAKSRPPDPPAPRADASVDATTGIEWTREAGTQVRRSCDVGTCTGVITDDDEGGQRNKFVSLNRFPFGGPFDKDGDGDGKERASRLRRSMNRLAPAMLSELEASTESRAFDGYVPIEDEGSQSIEYRHALSWDWSDKLGTREGRGGTGAIASASTEMTAEVTGVAWSASGLALAATYRLVRSDAEVGLGDDSGTGATHRGRGGAIVLWDLSRRTFTPPASSSRQAPAPAPAPVEVVEHDSGLTCVEAHPERPGVFGAGSSDGEVILFDFSSGALAAADDGRGRPQVGACSKIDEYSHCEPIASLSWSYDMQERNWHLCSVSGDGRVLYWKASNKFKYPIHGITLNREGNKGGDSSRGGRNTARTSTSTCIGGSAMAIAPLPSTAGTSTREIFVGSEGGTVARLLTSRHMGGARKVPKLPGTKMKWSSNALQLVSLVPSAERSQVARSIEKVATEKKKKGVDLAAVYAARPSVQAIFPGALDFVYLPHTGPVHCIDCSPFHRNIFLSCGDDGQLRIYSLLQGQPILVIDLSAGSVEPGNGRSIASCLPLYAAQFSRTKRSVLAAASVDCVYIYDLSRSSQLPAVTLRSPPSGESKVSSQINSVAFNGKIRGLFACGDANGVVHVWKLPLDLTRDCPNDAAVMANLFDCHDTT